MFRAGKKWEKACTCCSSEQISFHLQESECASLILNPACFHVILCVELLLSAGRFHLVQKTGQACTALAFSLRRTTEFLVALADYTIKCFDKGRMDTSSLWFVFLSCALIVSDACYCVFIFILDTKQLVSWMRGHEGAVSSISVHSSGRYAISTSLDTAQLWDLDTFQRKRKLNIRQSVGIQRVTVYKPLFGFRYLVNYKDRNTKCVTPSAVDMAYCLCCRCFFCHSVTQS